MPVEPVQRRPVPQIVVHRQFFVQHGGLKNDADARQYRGRVVNGTAVYQTFAGIAGHNADQYIDGSAFARPVQPQKSEQLPLGAPEKEISSTALTSPKLFFRRLISITFSM